MSPSITRYLFFCSFFTAFILSSTIAFAEVAVISSTTPWINEIHYDNAGGDLNEGFEIAGVANIDLALFEVALYNGSNGTVYNTIALTGLLPDEGAGGGALNFVLPSNGLQNGGPDGLALIEIASGTVVQFLSYEGSMMATNGPASGMTSTDIGVSETNNTPVDQSLQLVGTGCNYADFTWQVPATHSRGSLNQGQTFLVPATNLPPTSTCANPIIVNDPNQPAPNITPGGWGPIPANGMISILLGFPGGTSATIDLNCISDDSDPVGDLEIRLASSTILPGGTYILENVYDIRDSEGAEALGLITTQLTAGNQPPMAGAPRVNVTLPTSGGTACPAATAVTSSFGGPALAIGDIFNVDDVIFIRGIGVPVPTTSEVSDDTDLAASLIVNVTNAVVTSSTCTTNVAITYVIEDSEGAMSDPRTDTFLVIDDEAPVVACTEFSETFNRCPDAIFANTPSGNWMAVPASGIVQSAAGGSSIQSVDFGSCVSDNCNTLEYRISDSYEENRVPGCSLDIINEYEFRDICGNVNPTKVNVRFEFSDVSAPTVTCTDFSETFFACPDGLGPNTPTGAAVALPASGMFNTTIGGIYTATLDLSSCIAVTCGPLTSVELELVSSSIESSTPGCAITILNEYEVRSGCGVTANNTITFRGTVMLDPAGPTITAPGPVTINCSDDETDLALTGMATAGDACNPEVPSMPMPSALPVFINEIHYDNAGTDIGEGVEVAGPAGTDLSAYTISPYNGNGGGAYNVQTLIGTIPDEGNGFGAVWFPIAGLQNGAPDGVALCGPTGVLEFWSYESSPFPASNGCATGTTSTDLGVSEPGSTPVGESLQKVGSGSMLSAFTWSGPTTASPGSLNADQTIMTAPTGGGGGMGLPTTFSDVVTPGICPGNYTIERTFTAIDGCGNTATASQIITASDTEGPTFTTASGSLDATVSSSMLTSVSTGSCADDIDLVALAALAEASANGGPAFLLGALPVAMDNCSAPITYSASAVLGAASNSCLAILELSVSATDACGNPGAMPFLITYQVNGTGAATLPVPLPPSIALTSAGANCLMPFMGLSVGDMFAPGATVTIAGQPLTLPMATGCIGANPMFVVTATTSTPSGDPCVTNLTVDFEFNSGCTTAAIPYTLTVDLTDDTDPVVVAPANASITCLDDPNDLTLTGEATATDNCTPLMAVPLLAAGQVFINEIHYDNPGTDVGEFIEIAGPAGTDLAGYTLELINGGSSDVYDTDMLSGIIPDEGSGFGAIAFTYPTNGIQNGSPDGIALCGPTGVIEFLSYEGSITAIISAGCVGGLTSTDIGVAESFPTEGFIGSSLQRTGSGTNGGDFVWVGPSNESPGLLNVGQTFQTTPTGPTGGMVAVTFSDVVVPGVCASEFTIQRTWEAMDVCGNMGTALQIITVTDPTPPMFDQAPGALDNTITTSELAAAGFGNCAVQFDLATLPLNLNFALAFGQTNFGGIFELPSASDDCANVIVQASNVALLNVTGTAPCSAGIEVTYTATNDCGRMSTYTTLLTIVDDEAPVIDPGFGMAFTIECDMPFDTATLGQPTFTDNCGTSIAPVPAVWINEFHYDNNGGDLNEFVEVAGTAGVDLAGYSLEFYNGNGGAVYRATPLTGVLPDEGQGGGAVAFTLPTNGIQNGSPDGIALVDPTGAVVEFISYEGVMTASNGAASGQTSTDVGVSENASTLSTESLQRVGAGSMAASFIFSGPSTASPGLLNVNQVYLSTQTVTVTFNEVVVPDPTCPNGQTITREWTGDDGCGNITVATQIVTVIDLEAPVYVSFPRDTTVECSSLSGMRNEAAIVRVVADAQGFPIVEDNCTMGLTAPFTDVFTLSTDCPTVGIYERTFAAIDDGCGNVLPARTLTITVIDTMAPVFTAISIGGDVDCTEGVPPTGTATAVDCDPNVVVTEVDVETIVGENQVVSITERTITATDACGNSTSQVETYRVLDQEGPFLLSCPSNLGPIVARPDDMASVAFATPVFDDNCSFSVSGTATSGQDFPVGITTVTFTAIDGGGNITICEFEVEVVKALNLTCLDQDISIDDAGDETRADINFPYAATTCESCPQGEPLPSLEYLGYFRGHRYYVSAAGDTRSWTEAQRHAVSLGGRLVEVNSLEENRFLTRELPYSSALIGHFTGPRTTGWTGTFSPVIYENWATGFPTTGTNEFFALLDAASGTHSNVNHSEMPYIVEFPCVEIEVIDMPSDSLFDQGTNCVVYAAVDLCGNRDTCHYTFGVNTFDVVYCTPTMEAFGAEEDYYITGVSINAFAKTFDATSLVLHSRDTIELDEDNANAFSFSAETSGMEGGAFPSYWRVWVDANRDGDFYDTGEMIHQSYGDASSTGTLDLPSALQTQSPTRIRVAFSRYAYPEACGDNPLGDVKDFSVISDNPRSPRLLLTGARGVGQHLLTTTSEEDPEIASYLMLRGASADDLTKIDFWDALYGDGNSHVYTQADPDPMISAYYQAVALDELGFIIRTSNIVHLTMPVRRGPANVYPNPARHQIHVDFGDFSGVPNLPTNPTKGGKLELYDALGRVVATQDLPAGETKVGMPLPVLATGTYLLRISQPETEPQTVRVSVDQSGGKVIPRA